MSCAQANEFQSVTTSRFTIFQTKLALFTQDKYSQSMCSLELLFEIHLTVTTQPYYDYTKRKCFHIAHVPPRLNPGYAIHGPIIAQDVWTQEQARVQCTQVRICSETRPYVSVK